MLKKKLYIAGWIAALLLIQLVFGSSGFCFGKKEIETESIAVNLVREVQRGGYGIVRSDELKQWMDAGKEALIIDTMPYEDSYKKNHIPGAVQFLFPIPEMTEMDDAQKAKFLELLGTDKDKTLVFYCGFTKCTRSHNGAMWAVKLGYKNVYRCPGGIKAWSEADFPVEKVD